MKTWRDWPVGMVLVSRAKPSAVSTSGLVSLGHVEGGCRGVGRPHFDRGQAVGIERGAVHGAHHQLQLRAVQELRGQQFERGQRRHRDIQANASPRAPGVDAAVAEGGAVPAFAGSAGAELKGLVAGQFDVSAGVRLHQHQLALLGQHQQVRVDENQAAHAEVVGGPHQVAGAQLDAVERGCEEGAVVPDQRIDIALITYRGHPDAAVCSRHVVLYQSCVAVHVLLVKVTWAATAPRP